MSARRFTDKPELNPGAVRSLAPEHPAMQENRTIFPSTVVTVTKAEPDRLLISGFNNRKIGATVEKGRYKGYGLYCLSLEERATCPDDCSARDICYGSSMPFARRHRIGDSDVFFDRLGFEIVELLDDHPGLMIRLHVLGDFPSVEYVAFWKEVLDEYPNVVCWGYTHRKTESWGGDEIGDAIQSVKDAYPDRFRIRWSSDVSRPDGTIIMDKVPERPRIAEGLVCPAQMDATASCSTCALCWEAKFDTVVFIKHGMKSRGASGAAALEEIVAASRFSSAPRPAESGTEKGDTEELPAPPVDDIRKVVPLRMPARLKPAKVVGAAPILNFVDPTSLLIEDSYQRSLTGKSVTLIQKIVAGFGWSKFKPPVCVKTAEGLFIIDGQHTAIAAATHPDISSIPVLVVSLDEIEDRAEAFVAHNRDRLQMSPLQIFHAEIVAGGEQARKIAACAERAGVTVPRYQVAKKDAQDGQAVAISSLRRVYGRSGPDLLERILRIARLAGIKPIASTIIYALEIVLKAPEFSDVAKMSDARIVEAICAIGDFERQAQVYAGRIDQNRYRAGAMLIAQKAEELPRGAAA